MALLHRVLTIAGSDSGAGAGIQADLKAIAACGCYGASVVTAITAQNTCGVAAIEPVSLQVIEKQFRSVVEDIGFDAVKIGMLYSSKAVELISRLIEEYQLKNVVLDPVLMASSGDPLTESDFVEALHEHLLPKVDLVTPNRYESEKLGYDFENISLGLGARAVLVTDGDSEGSLEVCVDRLFRQNLKQAEFSMPRIQSRNTHGTGCTFSSAIASFLARGMTLESSIQEAKLYVYQCLQAAIELEIGSGQGPLNHFFKEDVL